MPPDCSTAAHRRGGVRGGCPAHDANPWRMCVGSKPDWAEAPYRGHPPARPGCAELESIHAGNGRSWLRRQEDDGRIHCRGGGWAGLMWLMQDKSGDATARPADEEGETSWPQPRRPSWSSPNGFIRYANPLWRRSAAADQRVSAATGGDRSAGAARPTDGHRRRLGIYLARALQHGDKGRRHPSYNAWASPVDATRSRSRSAAPHRMSLRAVGLASPAPKRACAT